MVKQEWWTPPQSLTADAAGKVKFHGFLGDYAVEAAGKGAARFAVSTAGAAEASAKLAPAK
jgi:hypothetical protein